MHGHAIASSSQGANRKNARAAQFIIRPGSPAVLIAKSMFLANQRGWVSVLDQGFNTKKTRPNTLCYTESGKKAKRGRCGIADLPPF